MTTLTVDPRISQASVYLSKVLQQSRLAPKAFMVLGSGFRDVVKEWNIEFELSMRDIPGYPCPTVEGHGKSLIGARINVGGLSVDALIATGRTHLYEGHTVQDICRPIFIAKDLGINSIILTNAAGGLSTKATVGSIIAISDHINLMGKNIAAADSPEGTHKFIEMVDAYDKTWLQDVCRRSNIESGVYAGMFGSTFETPAEARMLRTIGADLAGMSTVQETIAARMSGLRVFACSFVTNLCGEPSGGHSDVLKAVELSFPTIKQTLEAALEFV